MSDKPQCNPRLVKGFRDILPQMARQREEAMRNLEHVFQRYGYQPIDTPTLEYAEVLLSKSAGETEKQIFRFEDAGGRDVAMRFDLTVPFARFLAMHRHELVLPFRRYHIGKAWRGENPQKGRYREFYQCDFDLVGSKGLQADLDILLVAHSAMKSFNLSEFTIHLNHRQLVRDLLTYWGLQQQYMPVLGILDKIDKIGAEKIQQELGQLIPTHAEQLWQFITPEEDSRAALVRLAALCAEQQIQTTALSHLQQIFTDLDAMGLGAHFIFDPCITRGLDYYTGIVFETFLTGMKEIGSVCSGGRYDNLVSLYSHEQISGIGGSVGLDRLLAALEDMPGKLPTIPAADVMMMNTGEMLPQRQLQQLLQQKGINTACFPDNKKLDQQFRYAESLGARIAVFLEADKGYNIRNLAQRSNVSATDLTDAMQKIKDILIHS